ncbi:MAG: GAF domain-containing protein [Anaerolineae bacterium]|jgi:GAF domain-containing protein|nr:GAF domain-containing protein [Anaerolineae bacterium]
MAMSSASAMEPSKRQYRLRRTRKTDPQNALARLLRVWDSDGYEIRMATLLNIALLIGIGFSLLVPAFFVVVYERGLFSIPPSVLVVVGVISLAWHGLSIFFNKRGAYRSVAASYIGFVFVVFSAITLAAGGSRSSLWVFFIWPIVVSAVFLPSRATYSFFLGMVLLWMAVYFAEQLGIYAPPMVTAAEVQVRYIPLFLLLMLAMCITLLGYVFRHLSSTQAELEDVAVALQDSQGSLEAQIHQRTEEAGRFSEQVKVLQDLNRTIVLAVDMKDLLRRAVHLLSDAFNAYQVMIFLVDETGERLIQEMSVQESPTVVQLRVGEEGIVGHAASTGQPYVATDVTADPYYKHFPDLGASVSAAAFPIVVQDRTIGVLALESEIKDTFSEQMVEVLTAVANVLGVAILNTRNLEQLHGLLGRLSQYEEQGFLDQWRQVFERRQGRIGLLYDRIQVRGVDAAESEVLFAGSQPTQIEAQERSDGSHVLLVPLSVRDRSLGRLMFESDKPWREDERALVEAVTGQLGLALENARLLEATRRNATMEQTAGELTSRFRQQVEIEAVLQQALADLAQALDAERAGVRLALAEEREAKA